MQLKHPWQWIDNLYPIDNKSGIEALQPVAEICTRLAKHSYQLAHDKELFAVIGGDHSCAIGTWSGVKAAVGGPIGLLWVDAHMDSHTPETSISRNLHGMPLAALLGYGFPELTQILNPNPKILPQHVCLIGVRSFEEGEQALLKKLGVRIYYMQEVEERGLAPIMREALNIINQGTVGYGISFDVDGIDPADAPGVETRANHGIRSQSMLDCLQLIAEYPNLLGVEIAEFSPKYDVEEMTEKLIVEFITALLKAHSGQMP